MRMFEKRRIAILTAAVLIAASLAGAQSRGLGAIKIEDMKFHMQFLAAREFQGRSSPSVESDVAAKYIALVAQKIGLKPIMPNGSFFQELPVEVTTISPAKSVFRLVGPAGEQKFYFPQAFTTTARTSGPWAVAGELAFLGTALKAEDLDGIDLRGKLVVVLEIPPPPPADPVAARASGSPAATMAGGAARTRLLREKGAAGMITVISRVREDNLAKKSLTFDITERTRFLDVETANPAPAATAKPIAGGQAAAPAPAAGQVTGGTASAPAAPPAAPAPFYAIEVRHEVGAALLGVSAAELAAMFDALSQQKPLVPKLLPGASVEAAIFYNVRTTRTFNVVAYLPGSDPKLREEYVTVSSHHDHLPMREGRIFPGADDNISGGVAMFEIAKALLVERPLRSVIFIWNTAEEKGLVGSYYFVQHCPVPAEKISANVNLDMVSRNDPNSLYIIGSNKLSTEFDKSIKDTNAKYVGFKLDYKYEDPGESNRFFFRSDQYPYIRYGIPGVWLFSGTTEDYHQETDLEERIDYQKMLKSTKLAYAVLMDVGNKPTLCKLDVNPDVTTRGKHNMKVVWQRPPQPQTKR
jgi:hypothetical protein